MAHAPARSFRKLLMIAFGWIERAGLLNNRYDRLFQPGLSFITDALYLFALLVLEIKDCRAVAVADIRPLAVQLGWVVHAEEVLGKRRERDDVGIEFNQHGFGVASRMRADFFVRGILDDAASIAGGDGYNARYLIEVILNTPKATCCKDNLFHTHQCTRPVCQQK